MAVVSKPVILSKKDTGGPMISRAVFFPAARPGLKDYSAIIMFVNGETPKIVVTKDKQIQVEVHAK